MDRIASFIATTEDAALEAYVRIINRCYDDLSIYDNPVQFSGATEGVQEIITKGWDKLKEIVRKIINWFKELPSRFAKILGKIRDFFIKTPNEIYCDMEAAHSLREYEHLLDKANAITKKIKQLDAELDKSCEEYSRLVVRDGLEDQDVELSDKLSKDLQEKIKEIDAAKAQWYKLVEERDELRRKADAAYWDYSKATGNSNLEKAARERRGQTKVSLRNLKTKMKAIVDFTMHMNDDAKRQADHLNLTVERGARSGSGSAQRVGSLLARGFTAIGSILGVIPGHLSSILNAILPR